MAETKPTTPAPPLAAHAPSLESLSPLVGKPSEPLRNALFHRAAEEQMVEHGTRVDSQCILDDVPGLVEASVELLKRLAPEDRALVKLPAGLFALLVDEARVLARLKLRHDALLAEGSAPRPSDAVRETRAGLALRNITYHALRSVLGREGMGEIDRVVGVGDTPEKLAAGLEGLGQLLRKKLAGDPVDQLLLSEFALDEACARALHEQATRLRRIGEPPAPLDRVVTQRMLDLQDGRVLHLIAMVIRAFRAAHRARASIPVPELHAIAWMFDARAAKNLRPA